MNPRIIANASEFAAWLGQYNFFSDGYAANLQPKPAYSGFTTNTPAEVSFELGYTRGGGYYAGQKRSVCRVRFSAKDVSKWLCRDADWGDYGFEHPCIEDVELDETSDHIVLTINNDVQLECRHLIVEVLDDLIVGNRPLLSTHEVSIEVPVRSLPTPNEWITSFEAVGIRVTWRRLGDIAMPPDQVPAEDYAGWFIQEISRVEETQHGLLIKYLNTKTTGFRVVLNAWYAGADVSSNLWTALSKVAGSFGGGRIICGNCILQGSEWSTALEVGPEFLDTLDLSTRHEEGTTA